MSLKTFYTFYLAAVGIIVAAGLAVYLDVLKSNPVITVLLVLILVGWPLLLIPLARAQGRFAKSVRAAAFRVLRLHTFALFAVRILLLIGIGGIVALLLGIDPNPFVFITLVGLSLLALYLGVLILNGNLQSAEVPFLLIRKKNTVEVFLYRDGVIRHIPDPDTLFLMGFDFDQVVDIEESEFAAYRIRGPIRSVRDADLERTAASPNDIWMILGDDERRQAPDGWTLNYIQSLNSQRQVRTVSEDALKSRRDRGELRSLITGKATFR